MPLDAVKHVLFGWVDRFNDRRLLEPMESIPPAENEERWWGKQEQAAIAA